jgi:hypothetical protein
VFQLYFSAKWGESDMPARGVPVIRPLTIAEAAGEGSRRALLVALRARIALALENPTVPGRDLASLSLRLLEIVKEIEAIDAEGGGDDVGSCRNP